MTLSVGVMDLASKNSIDVCKKATEFAVEVIQKEMEKMSRDVGKGYISVDEAKKHLKTCNRQLRDAFKAGMGLKKNFGAYVQPELSKMYDFGKECI